MCSLRELGVEPAGLRLVATHSWDTLGATAAGCAAALVTIGNAVFPVGPQADIGADLPAVAKSSPPMGDGSEVGKSDVGKSKSKRREADVARRTAHNR
jgi:hypothetical protein